MDQNCSLCQQNHSMPQLSEVRPHGPRLQIQSPVCAICPLHHHKTEHRCPNPTCPKEGNLHPVANCCSASPAHCANCRDDHPATDPACPARPSRLPPANEVPPAQDHPTSAPAEGDMDTTEDEGEAVVETPRPSAPSTVSRLLPAFPGSYPTSDSPLTSSLSFAPYSGGRWPTSPGAPQPFPCTI